MVIVGNIDNRNLVLMISESGELYCDFGKVGNDAFEAFELLCTRKKRIVPWWDL